MILPKGLRIARNWHICVLQGNVIQIPTIHQAAKLIIRLSNVSFLQLWRNSLLGRSAKRFPARIIRDPVVLVPARG